MKYNEFISMIKRTQSQFEQTRKTAMRNLRKFWEKDNGQQFEKHMERMCFEHSEQQRQRRNRNRWSLISQINYTQLGFSYLRETA